MMARGSRHVAYFVYLCNLPVDNSLNPTHSPLLPAFDSMDAAARLNNLRESYHSLENDVRAALRVMVGDPPRLNAVRDRGLALASAAEQANIR